MIPIKAIVWDLDGTIIHFKIDYIKARRAALKILRSAGIPKQNLTTKNSILETVKTSRELFKTMGYNAKQIEKIIYNVDDKVSKVEYEAALKATMVNGVEKVLDFAKKNNLKQAIYTYNTNKNAQISLKKVGLLHYFDVIIGRNDVNNPKPHPDHLLLICKKLNVKSAEILVIGDNHRDIEGAININARSIAIKTKLSKLSKMDVFEKANKIIQEKEIPLNLINAIKEFL